MPELGGPSQTILEVCTCDLTYEQLEVEAAAVVKFLQARGVRNVRLECFEGVAEIAADEIPLANFEGIAEDRLEPWSGKLRPFDLTIYAENMEFEFCHHSGVHVRANEVSVLHPFASRWESIGYPVNRRCGEVWEYAES